MADPFVEYEKKRRTGARRLHPDSEANLGVVPVKGPSLMSRAWGWLRDNGLLIFALLIGISVATYIIKMPNSSKPVVKVEEPVKEPVLGSDNEVVSLLSEGFAGVSSHLNALSINIESLVAEIKKDRGNHSNPDLPIRPEPEIRWRTRWKTKEVEVPVPVHVPNPVNARLRAENARLRAKIADYDLKKKIIDDFYNVPIQAGYRRRLIHTGECP